MHILLCNLSFSHASSFYSLVNHSLHRLLFSIWAFPLVLSRLTSESSLLTYLSLRFPRNPRILYERSPFFCNSCLFSIYSLSATVYHSLRLPIISFWPLLPSCLRRFIAGKPASPRTAIVFRSCHRFRSTSSGTDWGNQLDESVSVRLLAPVTLTQQLQFIWNESDGEPEYFVIND
jgi:hypothetical protein